MLSGIYHSDIKYLECLLSNYDEETSRISYEHVRDKFYLYRDTVTGEVIGWCADDLTIDHPPDPRPVVDGQRPSWTDYFLGLAFMASRRSPDLSTKHGCILVDPKHHRVLSTGYNGYKAGVDDVAKATEQPKDYSSIIHSEVNSVKYCPFNLQFMDGVTAFVTGQICLDCAQCLIDHNVKKFVMANRRGFSKWTTEDQGKFDKLVSDAGVVTERVTPNLDWMFAQTYIAELRDCGFLS